MLTFLAAAAVTAKVAIEAFTGGSMLGATLYVASRSGKVTRHRVKK